MAAAGNLAVAQRLAAAGLPVFPCFAFADPRAGAGAAPRWRVKAPRLKGDWRRRATTRHDRVLELWRRCARDPVAPLPGIAVGAAGLVVLDADRHGEGPDGVAALAALLRPRAGFPLPPVTVTASDGAHVFFRQPSDGAPLGNERGMLPKGLDVRGAGGFVIAPGAVAEGGLCWAPAPGSPDLVEAFTAGAIPPLPVWLLAMLRARPPSARPAFDGGRRADGTAREKAYADAALSRIAAELAGEQEGARGTRLFAAAAALGRMAGAGWIARGAVETALYAACEANGLVGKDGPQRVMRELRRGLEAGAAEPRARLD